MRKQHLSSNRKKYNNFQNRKKNQQRKSGIIVPSDFNIQKIHNVKRKRI